MSDSSDIWFVGRHEEVSASLHVQDAGSSAYFDATDGYGKWWAWYVDDSGVRQYLQANLLTYSPTKHEFDFVFDGTSLWDDDIDFEVPATVVNVTLHIKKVLYWADDSVAYQWTESHYISISDIDDLVTTVGQGDVEHPRPQGIQP